MDRTPVLKGGYTLQLLLMFLHPLTVLFGRWLLPLDVTSLRRSLPPQQLVVLNRIMVSPCMGHGMADVHQQTPILAIDVAKIYRCHSKHILCVAFHSSLRSKVKSMELFTVSIAELVELLCWVGFQRPIKLKLVYTPINSSQVQNVCHKWQKDFNSMVYVW